MKKTVSIPASDNAESVLLANIRTLIESARNTVARPKNRSDSVWLICDPDKAANKSDAV